MEWTQWLPLIAGMVALLGIWGAIQHRLGRLEARMDGLEKGQAEAKAENIRLYEEAKAENIRLYEEAKAENIRQHEETRSLVRLALRVMREHTHADGSPATTPIPVDSD